MNRTSLSIVLMIAMTLSSVAQPILIHRRAAGKSTTGVILCNTTADDQLNTPTRADALGADSGTPYGGLTFTASSTYTLCSVDIVMSKSNAPTWTPNYQIYTNSGGTMIPIGSLVIGASASTLSASLTTNNISGFGASVISGGTYIVGVVCTNSPLNSTDFITIGVINGGGADSVYISATGIGAWTAGDTFTKPSIRTYK